MDAEGPKAPAPAPAPAPGWYVTRRDKVILGITLAIVLIGIGVMVFFNTRQAVWVVNGLDMPVRVDFDGDGPTVEPGGRVEVHLRSGLHRARVIGAAGELLEDELVHVPVHTDVVAYNVLGAAPLYLQRVTYSAGSTPRADDSQPEFMGGVRLVTRDAVQYVFEQPPASISVKQRTGTVVRHHFDQAPGGWRTTVGYLNHRHDFARAAELTRAVVQAEPLHREVLLQAISVIGAAQGVDAAVALVRDFRDRAPDDLELHLVYQSLQRRAGRSRSLHEEYRALAAASPGSPMLAVLAARLASPEEALVQLTALHARHPDDPTARFYAARAAFLAGRHAEAAEIFAKAAAAADPLYLHAADDHAQALVALGRAPEALERMTRLLQGQAAGDRGVAMLHGRLARLPQAGASASTGEAVWAELARAAPQEPGMVLWAASSVGETDVGSTSAPIDDAVRSAINAQLAAANDPAAARSVCVAMSPEGLRQIHLPMAVLLAAEFARGGDAELAERMLAARLDAPLPPDVLLGYVLTGADSPELRQLDPELRAALAFVRARKLAESGQKSPELEEQAERDDLLRGIVTRARARWPAPAPLVAGEASEDLLVLRRRPRP